jgi:hypothetical protein
MLVEGDVYDVLFFSFFVLVNSDYDSQFLLTFVFTDMSDEKKMLYRPFKAISMRYAGELLRDTTVDAH